MRNSRGGMAAKDAEVVPSSITGDDPPSSSHSSSGHEVTVEGDTVRHYSPQKAEVSYSASEERCKIIENGSAPASYGSINGQDGEAAAEGWILLDTDDSKSSIDSVAKNLDFCSKNVLKPYNAFLVTVGWRRFSSSRLQDHEHCCMKIINIVYLILIMLLIIAVSIIQILICGRRDSVVIAENNSSNCSNNTLVCLECFKHSVTAFPIPDLVLFLAYLYAVYVFRFQESEYLQKLTQKVFLAQGSIGIDSTTRKKQLTRALRIQLLLGILWLLFSCLLSTFRIIIRETSHTRVSPISNFLSNGQRYAFEAFCVLGFIIFDLAYLSVAINYSIQCQLLIYYVQSIKERVSSWDRQGKELFDTLESAMKEMDELKTDVLHLNRHISWAVSFLTFFFVNGIINASISLHNLSNEQPPPGLLITIASLNLLQWLSISVLPLVQAARLNSLCDSLKTLGHKVRSSKIQHTETSYQYDSFLLYTSTQQLSVEFLNVRMTPGIVGGGGFVILSVLLYLLQSNIFRWAEYL